MIVEIRFSPDKSHALLGPGVGRRTCYIELAPSLSFDSRDIFKKFEEIMHRYQGQPHLGKKTDLKAGDLKRIYGERFKRFTKVREQQDPNGKFLNAFTERVFVE
jgi:hypothetical protein